MKKLYHPTNPFLLTSLSITIDNYKLLEMCGHPTHNCLIHDFGHGLHDVIGPLDSKEILVVYACSTFPSLAIYGCTCF